MSVLESYIVNLLLDDTIPPNQELPYTSVAGSLEFVAALVIKNNNHSADLIIKQININNISSFNSTLPTSANLYRITAISGGVDITPVKMDSSIAALPSQIQIKKYPDSVTTSGLLRAISLRPALDYTQSLNGFVARRNGATIQNENGAEVFRGGFKDVNTQGIVLRVGEGVALTLPTIPLSAKYRLNCIFKTADGTYNISETVLIEGQVVPISIFNGVGSGKIVTILHIELQEVGEDTVPLFSADLIDDIVADTGITVPYAKIDSKNTDLQMTYIRKNARVILAGAKRGMFIGNAAPRRAPVGNWGVNLAVTGVDFTPETQKFIELSSGIRLKQGQGIAIIKKNASEVGKYEIVVEMSKEVVGYSEYKNANQFPMSYTKTGSSNILGNKIDE